MCNNSIEPYIIALLQNLIAVLFKAMTAIYQINYALVWMRSSMEDLSHHSNVLNISLYLAFVLTFYHTHTLLKHTKITHELMWIQYIFVRCVYSFAWHTFNFINKLDIFYIILAWLGLLSIHNAYFFCFKFTDVI